MILGQAPVRRDAERSAGGHTLRSASRLTEERVSPKRG